MNTLSITPRVNSDGELLFELLVDGRPIFDFADYYSDLGALQSSIQGSGKFFIVTCWCGCSECAGIEDPVIVSHKLGAVVWEVSDPEPKCTFQFDLPAYASAIAGAIAKGREMIRKDPKLKEGVCEAVLRA